MHRSGLIAVVATVPLAAAVWLGGQEEPVPHNAEAATREKIMSLVGRLGSSERSDRVAAERELLDYGPWALPLFPDSDEVPDPAARAALERVWKRLETKRAEESVAALHVTLKGKGNAAEVLKGDLPLSPEQAERHLSLDHELQPFWKVMDDLAVQIGGWPGPLDDSRRLTFRDRTQADDAKRLGYSKAFRFAAGPASLKRIAGDDGRHLVRVPVEVRAEPRLRPLFLSYASTDLTLTTAPGAALPPFSPEAKRELPFADTGGGVEPRLDFVANAAVDGPLTLAGSVRLTVAADVVSFVSYFKEKGMTDDGVLSALRSESRGGVTVRFREMTLHDDGTAEVEIAVDYGKDAPVFESHRAWVYHKDAHLTHDIENDGKSTSARIDPDSGFSVAEAGGAVVLRYRFSGIPDEAQTIAFTYRAPTQIVEVPVEFEVDGLTVAAEVEDAASAAPVNAGSAAGP